MGVDDPGWLAKHDHRSVVDRAVSWHRAGDHHPRLFAHGRLPAGLPRPGQPALDVAALLEVQDLRVEYVRNTGAVPVLNGVNLTIQEGQIVGVVGESGAGKSLLLRAILGLLD